MGDKKQIGVCLTSLQKSSVHETVNALCDGAKEKGYDVHMFAPFSDLSNGNDGLDSQKEIFQFIKYNRLDAVVIFDELICNESAINDIVNYAKAEGIPVIGVNSDIAGICRMHYDYKSAYAAIIEHVIGTHGSTQVNYLGYNDGRKMSEDGLEAYKQVLTNHQIQLEEIRMGAVAGTEESVVEYLNNYFFAGNYLPNAFICADDNIASAACNYFQKNNINIPAQTIITGMSTTDERLNYVPKITNAVHDTASTVEAILDAFEGIATGNMAADSEYLIPCRLEFAATCGCASVDFEEARANIKKLNEELIRERECFYDASGFFSGVCESRNINTLADTLPSYAEKAGITSYNIYIKSEFVEKAGIVAENVDNSVPLFWLSTYKDHDSTKIMFSLDWDRFHKSKNMLRADASQIMSIPLATDSTFYGFITLAYHSNSINNVYLYELIESINSAMALIFS